MKFSEYFKQRTCDLIARTEESKLAEDQEYLKQIRSLRYQNGALNSADFFGGVYILFVVGILLLLLIAAGFSGRQPEVLTGVMLVPVLLIVWATICNISAELVAALNRH